jgi:prophage regulatory protein
MPLISRNEVMNRTSLSRATLFRKERAGEFPKAVKISTSRVAYDANAVEAWIQFVLSTAEPETSQSDAAVE